MDYKSLFLLVAMIGGAIAAHGQTEPLVSLNYEEITFDSVYVYDDSVGNAGVKAFPVFAPKKSYVYFSLIGKSKDRYKVEVRYKLLKKVVHTGWIDRELAYVNFYMGGWEKLRWQPSRDADFSYIYVYDQRCKVIDFDGVWLKIEGYDILGQFFRGWLTPAHQTPAVPRLKIKKK
ncbi:MAG: hypothetical protein IJ761_07405 [Bacteroidales bacterium]|nr:hypothetical protein [Bacteroidales bacterium]